ncbi:unnamed protein product [Spirodela intermedia]|uniref:Uncharacterized protein n=1 Tax=Spirodela intermedia TaxID=51605 RepID=A0A7I8IUA6_SPIIN|nr:unnamed protein product [Spirodela intermedia]CAA6661614.1 unnamed protein product [Spirodela intermedia]
MATSMASSLVRRGFRLASSSALLFRHRQSPLRMSPISCSSSCSIFGVQTAGLPSSLRVNPSAFFASSAAPKSGDASLKKVLESEIQVAEEDVEDTQDESALPKNFPFTIIDNPGDQTITLKRQFGSENVEVSVFMEVGEGEDEGDDQGEKDDDATGDEEDSRDLSNISLVVTIEKGKGPALEFCCSLNSNEINIDSLTLKSPEVSDDQSPYEGPEFTDLDENLQTEFYNFLDRRGIKPSLTEFLQDYMIKKEEREYVTWLKNMKEFIEK